MRKGAKDRPIPRQRKGRKVGLMGDPITKAEKRERKRQLDRAARPKLREDQEDRLLDYCPADELPAWPYNALEEL